MPPPLCSRFRRGAASENPFRNLSESSVFVVNRLSLPVKMKAEIFKKLLILQRNLFCMKLLFVLLGFFFLTAGCHKIVEQAQENIVIKAMTDGQWHITKFTQAGADKTTDFSAYRFQFYANNTVEAINNGATEKKGTWQADPNARTITSTFTNATTPVMLLNGTWQITNNSWTFVEATQTVNGEIRKLRLDK